MSHDLILPSEIPWDEIKGSDLEELLYWLFDSMGAKDLEWRRGGTGDGAPDQGRDLELVFYVPSPEGSMSKQAWWVEAKGRNCTVSPQDVHRAVLNAAGTARVDVLVIATNSCFSNPTRDWVKSWQHDHPRPIIKLWERPDLERLCSENPLAVIRLYRNALSPQGKLNVLTSKLWNYASLSDDRSLAEIWDARGTVEIDERALFALVACECANGNVGARSWALEASEPVLESALCDSLVNTLFLASRATQAGTAQDPIFRAIAYLIIVSVRRFGHKPVSEILGSVWSQVDGLVFPTFVREAILEPVFNVLCGELKDVCASDCRRVMSDPERLNEAQVKAYWDRLRPGSESRGVDKRILTIEVLAEPCKVGFRVGKEVNCPLAHRDKLPDDLESFMQIVDQVVAFRMSQCDSN